MYKFSFGTFFVGVAILAIGGAMVVYHQKIADNLGNGVSSYERYRLWGLVTCGVGILVMLNVHSLLIDILVSAVFRR